jgi:hypothetical protein
LMILVLLLFIILIAVTFRIPLMMALLTWTTGLKPVNSP